MTSFLLPSLLICCLIRCLCLSSLSSLNSLGSPAVFCSLLGNLIYRSRDFLIHLIFQILNLFAGILGLAVVFVFMVIYYRFCGVVADLALLVNTVLVLGTALCCALNGPEATAFLSIIFCMIALPGSCRLSRFMSRITLVLLYDSYHFITVR